MGSYEIIRHEIKNVKAAKAAFARLEAAYKMVDAEYVNDESWQEFHGVEYKFGGLAWWKARVLAMTIRIEWQASTRVFISPPSEESRNKDSFEGGHHEVYTDRKALAAAQIKVAALLRG